MQYIELMFRFGVRRTKAGVNLGSLFRTALINQGIRWVEQLRKELCSHYQDESYRAYYELHTNPGLHSPNQYSVGKDGVPLVHTWFYVKM